jgi:hypothetical protein
LIEAGANVSARNEKGLTLLHVAAGREKTDMLIEAGAELEASSDGQAPLVLARGHFARCGNRRDEAPITEVRRAAQRTATGDEVVDAGEFGQR